MTEQRARRSGLRIYGSRGHPVVRKALVRFAKWLRANYEFPIRVPVYLYPGDTIVTRTGEEVVGCFTYPADRNDEPYIRLATGDYPEIRREKGRDDALAAFIYCMAHEVIHYQQWISTGYMTERGVKKKALSMMYSYSSTVAHP